MPHPSEEEPPGLAMHLFALFTAREVCHLSEAKPELHTGIPGGTLASFPSAPMAWMPPYPLVKTQAHPGLTEDVEADRR